MGFIRIPIRASNLSLSFRERYAGVMAELGRPQGRPPVTDLVTRLAHGLPGDLSLRCETEGDREAMASLYASTRSEELAPVSWPEETKQAFLRSQFNLQHQHYREHYPDAEFLVIERSRNPIGRIYVHRGNQEIRLMEIALLPADRGHGIGTGILTALLAYAQANGARVTLHVEPWNPAQHLYRRLGFTLLEDRGVYHFLEWRPDQLNTIS